MDATTTGEPPTQAGDPGLEHGARLSDQELIAGVLRREEAALGAIYDRYHRVLYAIALRITGDYGIAEEVIQDAFHAVWQGAGGFRPTGNLAAWLIGIVRHRAIDTTRTRSYRAHARERMLDDAQRATSAGATDELADRQAIRLTMRAALAELSQAQRQALDLAYYGGLTHVEIAAQIDVPLGTVKSRLRMGLEHLRQRLGHADLW